MHPSEHSYVVDRPLIGVLQRLFIRAMGLCTMLLVFHLPLAGYGAGPSEYGTNTTDKCGLPARSEHVKEPRTFDGLYCGPDSFWVVLMRMGINRSLVETRQSFTAEKTVDERCSLSDLKQKAHELGLHAYTVRLDRQSATGPAQCHGASP